MNDSDQPTPAPKKRTAVEIAALEQKLDRVDELVSLLVDELIDEPQFAELETLLRENHETRVRYVSGIQLHCDLVDFYDPQRQRGSANQTTVLSMLGNPGESGVHLPLPPTKPGA